MTHPHDTEAIIQACIDKTSIRYDLDGSFFKPRLAGINYLQLGHSKVLRNPLVLIGEWGYRAYTRVRQGIHSILEKLFPRTDKLWCNKADSYLTGTLHYAHREELNAPIHHLYVAFWGRTRWGQWRKLAEGYSNEEGVFNLPYELRMARNSSVRKLQLEIYQTTHVYFNSDKPKTALQCCYKATVKPSDLIGLGYNFRTIGLNLWEYRTDTPIPRTVINNVDNDSPQYYSQGRLDALYEQIIPLELIKLKHLALIAEAPHTLSIEKIQRDYPENLTVCIEKELPGYTRGDEWFGRRMMNGMNRGSFMPVPNKPGVYRITYYGVCNYEHNQEYALPTVDIFFELNNKGLPMPTEIHITGPTNAYNKDPWQKKIITPADGDQWLYAKRVARVSGAFSTEVDEHFTGTHLDTEQYAIAAYRNFRKSPLACLLLPHLKEVALVNHSADNLLIGAFIPTATALTEDGIHQRCYDILGMQDWKNWQPMKPLSDAHHCALAENLFWELTLDYVDRFFEEHAEGIKEHWYEVYKFAQDLTRHSVPVFLSKTDWSKLDANETQLAKERFEYYAFQYGFDSTVARETYNGELKSVSLITSHASFADTTPNDWQQLKQACAYIIMIATYMHTWINEHQYDDLGEVLYSSGGLRFGDKETGILAPESDMSIAPDLTRATQTLWFTNFLSRTEYGFITRNEEGDVNPLFIRMLLEKEKEFAQWGVNIHAIESRTNI